ncbi:MAG TPA: hypothetical protein VNV39_11350 [Stellaceae bacterium]|jgi:hypothetical protein|nr:hypothetical protein [Stellaceae bacterium]
MAVAILPGWRARIRDGRFRLALSLVIMVVLGTGGYHVVRYVKMLILLSSVVGAHNFEEDSAKNQRADEVYIRTDISDRLRDPDRTVVRLRRAHRWFWTTLVETDSFGVEERLKWVNDDTLEVTLGFGCLTHMTHPVEQIGSIRVSYHFSDDDKTLAKGCPD